MSKDTVNDWSTTAGSNTDIGGINIAEGCPPSGINNAIRTMMAQLKSSPLGGLSSLTLAADQLPYATGAATWGVTSLTAFARTILDDVDAASVRATIGSNNASNLTAGTVADARLPISQVGKTFTSQVSIVGGSSTVNFDFLAMIPTDAGPGKHSFFLSKNPAAAGRMDLIAYDGSTTNGSTFNFTVQNLLHLGTKIWTAGNDGIGSGLDADLLDGQDGSYYTNITARLGFTPIEQGGGASQTTDKIRIGWSAGNVLRVQVNSTDFGSVWPINVSGNAATATNASNADNLGGSAASNYAKFSSLTTIGQTDFPLGQRLVATGGLQNRRSIVNLYTQNGNNSFYTIAAGGTALAGTWVHCGQIDSNTAEYERIV